MKLLLTAIHQTLDSDAHPFFVLDNDTNTMIDVAPFAPELDPDLNMTTVKNYFLPFGIAQAKNNIYIASNHTICSFDKDTFKFKEVISTSGAIATHQIAYHDGYIYRTNTSNDTVTRINVNTKEEIHFSFKTMSLVDELIIPDGDDSLDDRHLNSVTIHNGLVYVLAHNRNMTESEVFILNKDMTSCKSLSKLDFVCHEIIIDNNYLYSLGTSSGTLIKLDMNTLEMTATKITDSKELFLRGAVLKNNKIVAIANQKRMRIAAEKDNLPLARKITIDLETLETEEVELPHIAEVYVMQEYID